MQVTNHPRRLKSQYRTYFTHAATWVGLFAAVGIVLLIVSRAATPSASIEPESGTGSGVVVRTDPSASGGAAIQFKGPVASVGVSSFLTGTTLTQYSLDSWGNSAAVTAGKTLLNNSTAIGVQHLMGFGALNPEPSPGVYAWTSLDKRFNTVLSGTNTAVLTACCAPDWMKGGAAGTTDFSTLEVAPFPEHYDDYADLVAATVARYPSVKYVQVWNEMKGFFSTTKNRWDYENYTLLYNKVWAKVKAVRPSVKIGGPYVVIDTFGAPKTYTAPEKYAWGYYDKRVLDTIKYWLQNKTGADFITIDGSNGNKDGVALVSRFDQLKKFSDTTAWIRSLDNTVYPGAKTLPLWWAEWYANTPTGATDSPAYKNSMMSAGLIEVVKSGAQSALIWGPQGNETGLSFPLGLFNDTQIAGGGQATLFHATQKAIHDNFSSGKTLIGNGNANINVETLSTSQKTLLVNKTNTNQTANVSGTNVALAGYEVRLINTP